MLGFPTPGVVVYTLRVGLLHCCGTCLSRVTLSQEQLDYRQRGQGETCQGTQALVLGRRRGSLYLNALISLHVLS